MMHAGIVTMVGSVVDITDRKQSEHALLEAAIRKDEFLATLAHELRNPLAPIRTALEVLKLEASEPKTTARAMMERQVLQMVRLIDNLLDVSRVSRGKLELSMVVCRTPMRSPARLVKEAGGTYSVTV